ncbi:Tyrosinase P [Pseudocercospora fuligena]|uniref:Tyrosinase P n=1 Tax=Pseudocercospora fuligena TaxID=685502 RepID=A0A8H6VAE7_9PEZI|nr:Tyrosinase P [Pseudocercospora fuligena]
MLNTIAALPIVLGLLSYASATPIHHQEGSCSEPLIRKEWRNLTSTQKKDYIGAIKCLQAKPKEVTPDWLAPAAVTRYDDFTTAHILQTNTSHKVGHLLPWHRYYLSVYERALREECNYAGAVPYWDWTLDVATDESFFNSPVFDPINGFGGNGVFIPTSKNKSSKESFEIPGRTGGGCIQNGPFKDDIITLGPTSSLSGNPRCLNRDLSPYWARRYIGLNRTKVTLEKSTFGDFTFDAELGPPQIHSGIHGGGHSGVGGIMRDPYIVFGGVGRNGI